MVKNNQTGTYQIEGAEVCEALEEIKQLDEAGERSVQEMRQAVSIGDEAVRRDLEEFGLGD